MKLYIKFISHNILNPKVQNQLLASCSKRFPLYGNGGKHSSTCLIIMSMSLNNNDNNVPHFINLYSGDHGHYDCVMASFLRGWVSGCDKIIYHFCQNFMIFIYQIHSILNLNLNLKVSNQLFLSSCQKIFFALTLNIGITATVAIRRRKSHQADV